MSTSIRNLFVLLLVGSGTLHTTRAQSIPAVKGTTIQAVVISSNGLFTYSYTVANPSSSSGSVWLVKIDISQPPGGVALSAEPLNNDPGFAANSSAAILRQSQTTPMVPVGIGVPINWMASLSVSGMTQWAATDDAFLIYPGQTSSGYALTSPGLPGLRTFTVEPYLDVDSLPIAPPSSPADLQRYLSDLSALKNQVSAQGVTVAPTAPPANFQPTEFLQTIQGYKERAFQQGWITDAGVANSLDVKLNAALAALQAQDGTTAKNILNGLLNEVHAQSGKHLTPEADALLGFNTQYLIQRI